MVSVCLPSDALSQHLLSYLGFSYLGHGESLHGCSSKAQPLLPTLDEGYLLTTALPDLQRGIAPLGPPARTQPRLLGHGVGCDGHAKVQAVLHSISQQIWKTQQWPQDWKRSVFIPFPRKAMPKNAQTTTQLHSSHTLVK